MRKISLRFTGVALLGLGIIATNVWAAAQEKPERVVHPKKWSAEVERIFSKRPQESLVGQRPASLGTRGASGGIAGSQPSGASDAAAVADTGSSGNLWSALISAEALEDEIKNYQPLLTKQLASNSTFNGGGFREAQLSFAMIAVTMAIIAEYDHQVRWKDQSPGVRDLFARAANNLRVPNEATFKESRLRLEDLQALVRGGSIDAKASSEPVNWDNLASLSLLMKRLDLAQKERLAPWGSNEASFATNASAIAHEAQIVAALAEVMQKPDLGYGDDETFAQYAREMQQAATSVNEAVLTNNFAQASTGLGMILQSCDKCHGDYR